MIERVDPYDHTDRPEARPGPSPEELLRERLAELRTRIAELDAQVVGLLARREALTRTAFEMVGGAGGPEVA